LGQLAKAGTGSSPKGMCEIKAYLKDICDSVSLFQTTQHTAFLRKEVYLDH
jgi:hypothetical protein